MTLPEKLTALVAKTSLVLTDHQLKLLIKYVELLNKWNKAYNLTSVRDPQEMLIKHIMDSLMVGEYLEGNRFIDVGTGPGLPGIPLAILFPEKSFTLLDSLGKRITFLRQVVYQLKLENVQPVKSRVEEFNQEQPFDGVLSRAFASLEDMVNWCSHLVSVDHGALYALKGQFPTDEVENLPEHIKLVREHNIVVPELVGERHLLVLAKQ